MEEDQDKIDVDSKKIELKNLLISNIQGKSNNEASSSHEDIKTAEESCKQEQDPKTEETETVGPEPKKKSEKSKKKTQDRIQSPPLEVCNTLNESELKSPSPTPARSSPEPSCAICLEHLTNKSFTNSCFHMFCFTCLVEWSKVKPECPLCKQSFTSIIHNVKSFQEYDQYHIGSRSRTPDSPWMSFDRRFRYRTTLTSDRLMSRAQSQAIDNSIISEIASHRLRYAPHSVHMRMYSQPPSSRHMPSVFRRRVYEENLWVHPPDSTRIRLASPAFFQRNIACTHRLLPWLNRELLVVMPHNEGEIGFMIDLIMSLILKYNIQSPEFFTHIEPYTGLYTRHFIHEFYNFAISPHEMEAYDFRAQYDIDIMYMNTNESSPDSDVIAIPSADTSPKTTTSADAKKKRKHSREQRHRNLAQIRRLEKLVLKRNSQNIWETVVSFPFSFGSIGNTSAFEVPGPSTSRNPLLPDFSRPELERNISSCIDDDEVEIVQVLKPKGERTPEIVNLSSDDENMNPTAEVTSTVKDLSLGLIELSSDATISSIDEDDVMFLEEKNALPDIPIDYSLKPCEKVNDILAEKADSPKPKETEPASSSSSNKDSETEQPSKNKTASVIKSTVQVVSNDDSHSSAWSPSTQKKRKKAISLEGSSTESFSDDGQVPGFDSNVKKLKLRSVVAHFSVDRGDKKNDSSHLSAYKKYKERRKKKKKRKHRHFRIYSSDSS